MFLALVTLQWRTEMKKFLTVSILSLALAFGAVSANAAQKTFKLKLGHTGAPTHHYQEVCTKFAEKVKARTNGVVEIAVFPADQLGKQLEAVEGAMLGTHDMVLTSDTVLSNWVPDMGILNLPFVFKDNWDVHKAVDGSVGEKLAKQLEPHGAIIIGWWENGMRQITNSKRRILKPEDMKGLKIRVPEGEVFVDTFKTLGAGPTVISFGELYSALQLGTVDGQENPVAHIITQKFYEVQKYVSLTNHIHLASPLIMNKRLFDSLPADAQKVILEEGKAMGIEHTKIVEALEGKQWEEVKAKGMIIDPVDTAPFQEMVKPVIEKAKKKYNGALIDEMIELVKQPAK